MIYRNIEKNFQKMVTMAVKRKEVLSNQLIYKEILVVLCEQLHFPKFSVSIFISPNSLSAASFPQILELANSSCQIKVLNSANLTSPVFGDSCQEIFED